MSMITLSGPWRVLKEPGEYNYFPKQGVPCGMFSSRSVNDRVLQRFIPIDKNDKSDPSTQRGYNDVCDCYCWGFRPPNINLMAVSETGRILNHPWNICKSCPPKCPTCPAPKPCPKCPKCPPQKVCPPCPECAEPAPCPACPTPEPCPEPAEPQKYGPTLGLLVAAVLVGGTGYYGYRKGWFG